MDGVKSFTDEHEAFAASRVTQFVYVPTKDALYTALDHHADALEGDVKPPLVLVGDEGSGKSALLANWVAKRREHKHRDEFLFQHFVGCSTPSLQLSQTLYRLETALKDFFQLREMKVPDTEEELRWSLNRFLSAAAKKHYPARIVIIIDGVHLLKNESGPDGALYWLPTELPPCVRFIVSTVEFERQSKTSGTTATAASAANQSLLSSSVSESHALTLSNSGPLHSHNMAIANVSTTSQSAKPKNAPIQHRTFIELNRRQCPLLRMEPLGVATQHNIINAFMALNAGTVEFTESQQFKIKTSSSTSQPMYLRSLLQSIRLASKLTKASIDELLDTFLSCNTAHEVIDQSLNICCTALFSESENFDSNNSNGNFNHDPDNSSTASTSTTAEILAKIFSMVYASRNGLTMDEIWAIIRMVMRYQPEEELKNKLFSVLSDFTMVVDDMHSFSHEVYREVVYSKFINSRESLNRWHYLLSRFFGQLPPCDRKLVALPYHLEEAGSWSKVKNCLTDIELFRLWWTPKFKVDFIKFWSSLTKQQSLSDSGAGGATKTGGKKDKRGESGNDSDNTSNHSKRPSYDIVDEYVKSLDEYRTAKHPTDEAVANIILEIGDFLLEFATLGHEAHADVPNFIHPHIPSEDLGNIGVPYISTDEEGRSMINYPEIFISLNKKQNNDDGLASDTVKAIEDIPICTTYYFQRWMWIQFPYIALGNCDTRRFREGVERKLDTTNDGVSRQKRAADGDDSLLRQSVSSGSLRPKGKGTTNGKNTNNGGGLNRSISIESFKLPEIKFNRKAAKSTRRVPAENGDDGSAPVDKVSQRLIALQDDIQNYREEHDFIIQMKATLTKRLAELKGTLEDLKRSSESCSDYDSALNEAIRREQEAFQKCESVKVLNQNLQQLHVMCERHPANVPALVEELQFKLEQDKFLLREIKKRLWEQKFEHQMHTIYFRKMKQLVAEGVEMHNKLLEYRYSMKKGLQQQQIEDEKRILKSGQDSRGDVKNTNKLRASRNGALKAKESEEMLVPTQGQSWDEVWSMISMRTGIIEPELFFQRINNGKSLEEQINMLKKSSEARLEFLKKEVVNVESELEETRYKTSFVGGQSTKEQEKILNEKMLNERHLKERTEASEQLSQKVISGLAHIGEMLGIPPHDEDTSVSDILRDIEAVLDTLMDEREKQLQQQGQLHSQSSVESHSRMGNMPPMSPETHVRSPELDVLIAKYEVPKSRLPAKLPSRPSENEVARDGDDMDELDEDGTWDRVFVKTQSMKNLKAELKKAARQSKAEAALNQTL